MKLFLRRIGGRDAINWVSILGASIFQTLGMLSSSGAAYASRFPVFICIVLISIAGLAGSLGIGALILKKVAHTTPKPLLALSFLLSANFVRSFLFDNLLVYFHFTEAHRLLYRFSSSLVGAAVIYLLAAYFVSNAREIYRRNQELTVLSQQLKDATSDSLSNFETYRTELIADIQARINSALHKAQRRASEAQQKQLGVIIDEIIRPTSYELYKASAVEEISIDRSRSSAIAWKEILVKITTVKPFPVRIITIWLFLSVCVFLIPIFGSSGISTLVAATAAIFLILSIANRAWSTMADTMKSHSKIALLAVIVCATSVVVATIVSQPIPAPFRSPITILVLVFQAATIIILPSFVVASASVQISINTELDEIKKALQRELATVNALRFQFRKSAARMLHGPIQDLIAATIVRLSKSSTEIASADLENLGQKIEQVWTNSSVNSSEGISLAERLKDLQAMWDVVAHITFTFNPKEIVQISNDTVAASALYELVRESCANAINHGKAKNIQVQIALDMLSATVLLTVHDNGIGLVSNSRTGLGTQLFDDFTVSWQRSSRDGKTTVSAQIPLAITAMR